MHMPTCRSAAVYMPCGLKERARVGWPPRAYAAPPLSGSRGGCAQQEAHSSVGGARKEKRRSRPKRQSPRSTVGHEGSQSGELRDLCVRCAKTGASGGARARCCACAHARLRGALEKAAASEATRLRMMQGGGARRPASRKGDATGWPCRARQRGDGRSAPRRSLSSRRRGGTKA